MLVIFFLIVFFGIGLAVYSWQSFILTAVTMFGIVQLLSFLDNEMTDSSNAGGINLIVFVFIGGLILNCLMRTTTFLLTKLKSMFTFLA